MQFTRRQWLGASAAGTAGAVAVAGWELSPIAKALAEEPDAAQQLAAIRNFSGKVPHATHYGPLIATVEKGRLVKVEPQATDAMPTPMLTEGVIERTYDKTRVAGPMVRKHYLEAVQRGDRNTRPDLRGNDEWVQVSWDTALGLTAKAILDTVEQHGNEACFSSSYGGWSHAGIFRPNVLQGAFSTCWVAVR